MKRLIALAAILLGAAISADAQAATFVHGNVCQNIGYASPTTYGMLGASNTIPATVWCGLGRGATSVGILGIRVFDRNPVNDFSCEVWGLDDTGFSVYDSGPLTTSGAQTNAMWLNAVGIPSSVETFAVKCTIPPGLNSYLSGFNLL